jgi:hypothetical protein
MGKASYFDDPIDSIEPIDLVPNGNRAISSATLVARRQPSPGLALDSAKWPGFIPMAPSTAFDPMPDQTATTRRRFGCKKYSQEPDPIVW